MNSSNSSTGNIRTIHVVGNKVYINATLEEFEEKHLSFIQYLQNRTLRREHMPADGVACGDGIYSTVANEDEFIHQIIKKKKHAVCHFYCKSNTHCAIVDKHLAQLAWKHLEAKFCKIDVEKTSFLRSFLNIRVIPTIVVFKDWTAVDTIAGFSSLGGANFTTEMMEWRLARHGVLNYNGDLHYPAKGPDESHDEEE